MNSVQIKICGVTNLEDARACAELGVNMIGFNFYPQSPRYVPPELVQQITRVLPATLCAVGVFVDANADQIRKIAEAAALQCVQLHGHTSSDTCSELAGKFRVIRAFPTDPQFRAGQVSLFGNCDVLIDAYRPDLHGGTGQICNWSAARTARSLTRFLILSGGLNEQNVRGAIAAVAPHAVDVCSGVESEPGVKNHRAIENFVAAVRSADSSLDALAP